MQCIDKNHQSILGCPIAEKSIYIRRTDQNTPQFKNRKDFMSWKKTTLGERMERFVAAGLTTTKRSIFQHKTQKIHPLALKAVFKFNCGCSNKSAVRHNFNLKLDLQKKKILAVDVKTTFTITTKTKRVLYLFSFIYLYLNINWSPVPRLVCISKSSSFF